MNSVILEMLEDYSCKTRDDYQNALKEIIQEVALLGLWRAKFFEHALFYGGSALRILYNLPRFSEDLDFSLLAHNDDIDLAPYYKAIKNELESFGLTVHIEPIKKDKDTPVESAFIKASTKIHMIKASVPLEITSKIQGSQLLKIKIEVDTDPPKDFGVDVKSLLRPIPFQVKTMPMHDLFAGKCHACLARGWGQRVKGRDFFDYLWYLRRKVPINIKHLKARLVQSGHWRPNEDLNLEVVKELFRQKFKELDIEKAKKDVAVFLDIKERASLEIWSHDFFVNTVEELKEFV